MSSSNVTYNDLENWNLEVGVPDTSTAGNPVQIPIRIRHEDNDGGLVPVDDKTIDNTESQVAGLLLPAVNQLREAAHRMSNDADLTVDSFIFADQANGNLVDDDLAGTQLDIPQLSAERSENTRTDYDDDGDLDLYVINSPGGDNASHGWIDDLV